MWMMTNLQAVIFVVMVVLAVAMLGSSPEP